VPGDDTILSMSQLAGNQDGLTAPQIPTEVREGPDAERFSLEELLAPAKSATGSPTPEPRRKPDKVKTYARVFVVGPEGNAEYEHILDQGTNGKVVLARREIHDMQGSASYKVYLEWFEMIKAPKKKGAS
jgi:hypothetical protein